MELRILGSGGNSPVPMPTCQCAVCTQARDEGVPYARGGNSLYLPAIEAMVDAPEFTYSALNRERVSNLEYILLTHWHPDHVNGLRVLQSRDATAYDSFVEAVMEGGPTIVTTRAVYERTREVFGQLEHFIDRMGFADVQFLDEEPLRVDGTTLRSVPYALEGGAIDATAFVVEDGDVTVLVASDDARHLPEGDLPSDIDLAVFECGLFEHGPDGGKLFSEADWDLLGSELTHTEVMDRVDRVDPKRVVLTEIEHLASRSYDHFRALESESGYENVRFAYDGLELEVD